MHGGDLVATPDITARPLEWNPPRQAISRVPYLPGLDGMRALAVVAVMLYHTNNGWLPGGFIGVEVFFVISGYLITLLLIGEHEKTGHIDLKQFWIRRAKRLLPALFLMMALLMVYSALFERDTLGKLRGDVLAGLGYITNWYQIWIGAGYTSQLDFAPLRHLWSLAVEEQFYLVWPLVMVGLIGLGRRRLPNVSRWLVLAAVVIAVVVGVLFYPGRIATPEITPNAYWGVGSRSISKMDTLYLSTVTRATGLLVGAAFAMLWRPVAVMRGPLRRRGRELDVIAVVGLAGLGVAAWFLHVVVQDGPARRPVAVPRGLPRRRRRDRHDDGGGDPPGGVGRSAARHARAELDRHPVVRVVPVPLADLPDHSDHRGRRADGVRVRRRDGRDGGDHGAVVPVRRDADSQGQARRVVGAAARGRGPDPPAGGRHRGGRLHGAVRIRGGQHGHRRAQTERGRSDTRRRSRHRRPAHDDDRGDRADVERRFPRPPPWPARPRR